MSKGRGGGERKATGKSRRSTERALPSEAEILDFLQTQTGRVGKREIARAFNIKGADRIALKQLLKDMTARGLLRRDSRALENAARLPPVTVLEVVDINDDGDLVATPSNWDADAQGVAPRVIIPHRSRAKALGQSGPPPGIGNRVLAHIDGGPQGETEEPYTGRVIKVLDQGLTRTIGVFRIARGRGMRVQPVDKKNASDLIVLPGDDAGAQSGELVSVDVIRDRGRGPRRARVRERLGDLTDQRNISLIAIHQHGLPDHFRERTLAEVEKLKPVQPRGRTDLRDVPLITIDPPDARDHDDAVWAAPDTDPKNEGGFRVIVAIADVAAYVRPGTAIDREARDRGNSVYFPDRVVPMLPERLSADLCSLRPNEERPAIACSMIFDRQGRKLGHSFARVIMRSAAKLSYEQAQAAIDGRPDDVSGPLLEPVLKPLWAAYRALAAGRRRRGPLELDLPERKLILDALGLIDRVITPERLDAHRLIEEMMIQANVSAAESLEERKVPFIYRVHDAPAPEKVEGLIEFLATLHIPFAKGQVLMPKHFNRVLDRARGSENEHLVNTVVLRSQAQAIYSPENRGHFGLNLRRYAHFTSPIRRYADLIVHRALITAFGFGKDGLSQEDIERLEETSELISAAERRAMAAERDTVDRLVSAFLADKVGAIFHGRIGGVAQAGLFIALAETGADGFVPAATLGGEYYDYDEANHALVGRESGDTYQLGDPVEVRLAEATPVAGGLRFEMISPGKPGKPLKSGSRALRGRRGRSFAAAERSKGRPRAARSPRANTKQRGG
ncbi:ribonuclease R [Rhodoligotrophos defluvii]|uniref:ribonuclease R n=1 Tax=Rhodoligotrophos defluvii TaxID=2561934 RepID=UPI0010CA139E|nr:ribonuclease R [Rhodoligotrophos defluvii]